MGFADQGGPKLAFGPDRDIGPPVVEETMHEGARIQRHILVHRARGQAVAHHRSRGHGARRHEDGQVGPFLEQQADQFQKRKRLAHAGGVKPDQRPRRAG